MVLMVWLDGVGWAGYVCGFDPFVCVCVCACCVFEFVFVFE